MTQILNIDESNENIDEVELVDEKGEEVKQEKPDSLTLASKVKIHPTMIFAEKLTKDKTPGGIYIPESAQDKELTPLVRVLNVGEEVTVCKVEDLAYINPSYMQFAKINGVSGIILFQDAILATYTEEENE